LGCACSADYVDPEDVIRFDSGGRTFAIYRYPDAEFFLSEGLCTHEKVHLADGLVTSRAKLKARPYASTSRSVIRRRTLTLDLEWAPGGGRGRT
jgi:nitrite reductase/ring-hydroxylating ferredoxin subunit